jgi:uncharacterized protein YkwD
MLSVRRVTFAAVVVVGVAVLGGCSGGAGGGPSAPGGPAGAASVEAASFARVNDSRREADRPELMPDPVLAEIARQHSRRMRDEGFFDHVAPDGSALTARLATAGVRYSAAGENLAWVKNSHDPAGTAHKLLMDNPEHRRNILDARFTDVGVGVAQGGDTYWITQIFVRR